MKRQCPDLIFVKPRFEVYNAVSRQTREIFAEHTASFSRCRCTKPSLMSPKIFRASHSSGTLRIRDKIKAETGHDASDGVSYNKFLAKLASDHRKPNGQFVISPEMGPGFVENESGGSHDSNA